MERLGLQKANGKQERLFPSEAETLILQCVSNDYLAHYVIPGFTSPTASRKSIGYLKLGKNWHNLLLGNDRMKLALQIKKMVKGA